MSFPFNFIIIPAIIIATAVVGSKHVKRGLKPWYKNLKKPSWTPSGKLIGEIWFFLYIITGFAILWYWNVSYPGWFKYLTGAVLLLNAYLNANWNKIFFVQHDIPGAIKTMKLLNATTVIATVVMFIHSPIASFFMLPYIIWVSIATRLTKQIHSLNK